MANRDEILRFVVQTEQGKDLLGLAKDIAAVGDAAGQAESEANAFLAEFASASRLQAAADQFRALGRSVIEYEGKIRTAKAQVSVLGKEISSTAEPTRKQEAAFAAAKRELDRLTTTQDRQRSALRELRSELQAGGISAANLARGAQELGARSLAAADGLRDLATRTRQAAADAEALAARQRDAVSAATQLAAAYASDGLRGHRERQQQAAAAAAALTQKEGEVAKVVRELAAASQADGLASLAKGIEAVAEAAGKGEPKARELVDEFRRLNEAGNAVNSLAQLKARLQETGERLAQARRGLAELNTQFSVSERSTKEFADAYRLAQKVVDDLAREERLLEVEVKKASGTVQKHGLDVNNLSRAEQALGDRTQKTTQALREYITALNAAGQGSDKAKKKTEDSVSAFDKLRGGINSTASAALKLTGLSAAISAALSGLGAGALFSGAIESATKFEQKLTAISAVTGASKAEMAQFKKAAEAATRVTTFSASEAADALLELAKASGDAKAATEQLAPTLNLAQAAGIDTAESAQILTTTLTQFGLAASDAARVADLFVTEANSTEDSVSKLGNAMSYVAPLARQLGLSLEDTTAIIGALAKESFKGERAGTALRNVFSQLSDPASKFSEALRGLGITSTNFIEVIKKIVAAGDRGKVALLALDAEARPAIQALVNSGAKNLDVLAAALKNSGGEAERQAVKMGQSFDGASKRLSNAFDQLRRDLVEPILEPVAAQFDDVAKRVRAFTETADFEKIIAAIKSFALQATDALIELGKGVDYSALAAQIQNFSKDATEFFKELKDNAGEALTVVSAVVDGFVTVWNSLQAVVLTAATVVAAALTSLAHQALLFAKAMSKVPGAGEAMKGVVEKLTDVVGGLTAVTEDFGRRAGKNFKETGEAAERFGEGLGKAGSAAETNAPKVAKVGEAAGDAAPKVEELGNKLNLIPNYTGPAANAVEQVRGPVRDFGRDALLGAQHITRFSDATQKLGGGPVADATKKVREAEAALSALNRSTEKTPYALQQAERAVREARAELERVKESAGKAKQGSDDVKGAFHDLGIVSQAALREAAESARLNFESIRASSGKTAAGIADTRNAFIAYAEKVIESVAAADAATRAKAESTLRAIAAQIGAVDKLNAAFAKSGASANLYKPPTDGLRQMGSAAQKTASDVKSVGDASQESGNKTSDFAERGGDALAALTNQIAGVRSEFLALGETAAKAFDDAFANASRAFTSIGPGIGFDSIRAALRTAQDEVQASVDKQRDALASLTASLNLYAETGQSAFSGVAAQAQFSVAGLDSLKIAIDSGTGSFDLLGRQELGPLQAAIEAARAKTAALQQQAKQATESLRNMAQSTQDEIDRLRGNEASIEDRRHQARMQEIQDEAALAGETGSQAAQDALAAENELHALRMANIQKENAERAKNNGGGGGSSAPAAPPAPARPSNSSGGGATKPVINVTIQGNVIGNEDYTRQLSKDLRRFWERGG
ncbi:MAG: phage tail tape measure protein [Xanthomonadaceae bacterium]|nr:phage tail tape measure protein [Xanthomonadaceae bacterium]